MQRGTEDTGRFEIWAEALQNVFYSPLIGMGASNASVMYLGDSQKRHTTHNSLLYFALASGIVPLVFFVCFWIRTLRRSLLNLEQVEYGPFRTPLSVYVFI